MIDLQSGYLFFGLFGGTTRAHDRTKVEVHPNFCCRSPALEQTLQDHGVVRPDNVTIHPGSSSSFRFAPLLRRSSNGLSLLLRAATSNHVIILVRSALKMLLHFLWKLSDTSAIVSSHH